MPAFRCTDEFVQKYISKLEDTVIGSEGASGGGEGEEETKTDLSK